MEMNVQVVLFLIAVCICFLLSYVQTHQLAGCGTDHKVHRFLANVIRENRHRLFVKVPRLLNEAPCTTGPLFLDWILSFLNESQIEMIAQFLNPLINSAVIAAIFITVRRSPQIAPIAGWASLGLALTPQFYHAYSARNYGLSARPIGVLLFTLICINLVGPAELSWKWPHLVVPLMIGYLIWGFSTFTQQIFTFMSLIMGLLFKDWRMAFIWLGSVMVFIAVNPKYSVYYLKYTLLSIKTYATDLAAVFINKQRYSIWRDLVYDIWQRIFKNRKSGLMYAYGNAVLIVTLLNPLMLIAVSSWFIMRSSSNPAIGGWEKLTLSGFGIFMMTTFRMTRFLGEPERYVEIISPVAAVVGVYVLYYRFGMTVMLSLLGYCACADAAQIVLSGELARRLKKKDSGLAPIREVINVEFGPEPVRFCSNDEQVTKYFMTAPWEFARIWSAEQSFGGVRAREAFSEFPFIRQGPFETVLRQYRINACVLVRDNFDEIFHGSDDARRLKLLSESDQYRVYRIHW